MFDALPLDQNRKDVAWLALAAPYAFASAVVASVDHRSLKGRSSHSR